MSTCAHEGFMSMLMKLPCAWRCHAHDHFRTICSPSITDNPLIVTNVVKLLQGKTAYIDIEIQVIQERILIAILNATIVAKRLAEKKH